jgi:hypothetical protein
MANNTILVSTASPVKPRFGEWRRGRPSELLLAANCCIPLFWYMLFDEQGLIQVAYAEETDSDPKTYTALSGATSEALALARSRWPRVRDVLGAGCDDLFERWFGFVAANANPYLHCETWEWSWLWRTPRAFESHLRTCIRAFAHTPRSRRGRPALNKWWREILGQCAAIDRCSDDIHPLGEFTYCGHSWGDYVIPWAETTF